MTESPKRCACGRRGERDCPAVGGVVCAACCGSQRGSKLSCPADCRSYPFGRLAYDVWLRMDAAWTTKASDYVVAHLGRAGMRALVEEVGIGEGEESEEALIIDVGLAVHHALFLRPDQDGLTLADRWEQEDSGRRLNNDERVLMRYRRHSFPTLLEVQQVLDGQSFECLDLLEEGSQPFVVFDRSMAARVARFTRLLVWICDYPHFTRIGPAGLDVPRHLASEFQTALAHLAAAGGPAPSGAKVKEHLKSHFPQCCALLSDMCKARFQHLVNSVDVHHCTGTYDLTAPLDQAVAILQGKPDFEFDEEALEPEDPPDAICYRWLRRGESKALEGQMPGIFHSDGEGEIVGAVGKLKLSSGRLIVETFSRQKFEFAKKMIERYFGGLVSFRGETVVDLARQAADRLENEPEDEPEDDPRREELPERVPREAEQQVMERVMASHYRNFLDAPIPMLDGKTPRQAAADPAMRPQLIELMKVHLHGVESQFQRRGLNIRIDWVLDELGLTELRG